MGVLSGTCRLEGRSILSRKRGRFQELRFLITPSLQFLITLVTKLFGHVKIEIVIHWQTDFSKLLKIKVVETQMRTAVVNGMVNKS